MVRFNTCSSVRIHISVQPVQYDPFRTHDIPAVLLPKTEVKVVRNPPQQKTITYYAPSKSFKNIYLQHPILPVLHSCQTPSHYVQIDHHHIVRLLLHILPVPLQSYVSRYCYATLSGELQSLDRGKLIFHG
jgi:hypothetical protein